MSLHIRQLYVTEIESSGSNAHRVGCFGMIGSIQHNYLHGGVGFYRPFQVEFRERPVQSYMSVCTACRFLEYTVYEWREESQGSTVGLNIQVESFLFWRNVTHYVCRPSFVFCYVGIQSHSTQVSVPYATYVTSSQQGIVQREALCIESGIHNGV